MSDLHLERTKYTYEINRAAPTLLLGGDIGRFCDFDAYLAFIRRQCEKFDKVLLVAGNHEFYGSSRVDGLKAAEQLSLDPFLGGKLTFLSRTRVDLAETNVVVLGCTLQSYIAPDYLKLTNDFQYIKSWSVKKHNAEHELDVQWLRESLKDLATTKPRRRVVIITHYAPAFEKTCHPKNESNDVSQCFSSDTLQAFKSWKLDRSRLGCMLDLRSYALEHVVQVWQHRCHQ